MGLNSVKDFFGFSNEEEDFLESPMTPSTSEVSEPEQASAKPFKGSLMNNKNAHTFTPSEIKVEEPRIYEDSLHISGHLRENKPVIINLKHLDADAGKRLIDFVCGTAYAINGHMLKIGENIFLFTPANVLIVDGQENTTLQQGMHEEEKNVFFNRATV